MSWFKRDRKAIESSVEDRRVLTEGLWIKCEGCREPVWKKDLEAKRQHLSEVRLPLQESPHTNASTFSSMKAGIEFDNTLRSTDPLKFKAQKHIGKASTALPAKVGVRDAVVNVEGTLDRESAWSCLRWSTTSSADPWDPSSARKLRGRSNAPSKEDRPLIVVSCSGGARMQEGVLSLMQMAKISAALALLDKKGIPYISILTNPTTGGVTASFAMLGDLNIAEPGALIGFAGPRVIEQTIRQKLPEGFQRAEFLVEHGMIDKIVSRKDHKAYIATSLRYFNR